MRRAGECGAVTAQRIDATWAAFFGLSLPAFLRPGIQVVAHCELAEYRGVWLFRRHSSLCISVPSGLVEGIRAVVGGYREPLWRSQHPRSLWASDRANHWAGISGLRRAAVFSICRSSRSPALRAPDQVSLRQLADACEVEAWEHAGITVDEPHVFGCFVDDHLVAAARYRPAWGETAHIGVVTHPAYRRRHYGSAVVSTATAQALAAGYIVLYQTLLANAPSVALATGLGYQAYASHLAVRLVSDGA
jgi:GNAT superfamily N-acetyltransferase